METLTFDVMLGDRYVCTMRYRYCPLFPVSAEELRKFVISKRPTLRDKDFRIEFKTYETERFRTYIVLRPRYKNSGRNTGKGLRFKKKAKED